ncbi:unnamed protein product, partial [Mycena citricolor]
SRPVAVANLTEVVVETTGKRLKSCKETHLWVKTLAWRVSTNSLRFATQGCSLVKWHIVPAISKTAHRDSTSNHMGALVILKVDNNVLSLQCPIRRCRTQSQNYSGKMLE